MAIAAKREKKPADGQENGSGEKKKVFSESFGKEHLLSLSRSIAEKQSTRLKERVDRAKEKASWEKEKRAEKARSSVDSKDHIEKKSANPASSSIAKNSLSKGSIRAGLLIKQREKSRKRKEARKEAAKKSISSNGASTGDAIKVGHSEKKVKRVSFV